MLLPVLFLLLSFAGVRSMPYQVPLQGLQGGKRTLILLDNMVTMLFADCAFNLIFFHIIIHCNSLVLFMAVLSINREYNNRIHYILTA